jgi:hypothetical protein
VTRGDIIICQAIYDEIMKGNDDLKQWMKDNISSEKIESDSLPNVVTAFRTVVNAVDEDQRGYTVAAKSVFCTVADSLLIAHALAGNYVIATLEVSNNPGKKQVKIPDAATLVGVRCTQIKSIFGVLSLHL